MDQNRHMHHEQISREIGELKTAIAVVTERLDSWIEVSTDYRHTLCKKLDIIQEKLDSLTAHAERMNGIDSRLNGHATIIKSLWIFVTGTFLGLVYKFFR